MWPIYLALGVAGGAVGIATALYLYDRFKDDL